MIRMKFNNYSRSKDKRNKRDMLNNKKERGQ